MKYDRQFDILMSERLGTKYLDAVSIVASRYGKPVHLKRPLPAEQIVAYLVHHSTGRQRVGLQGQLRATWDYHIRYKRWSTGGYALLIDREGFVAKVAQPFEHMTYNAGPWNPRTVGICCVGNYETSSPSGAMLNALYVTLCSLDDCLYRKWRPHNSYRQTLCPGKNLEPHVWRMTRRGATVPRPEGYMV